MSDVGVFFGGEHAPCVGVSAASMAAVRRVLGRHGGPPWRCGAMRRVWRRLPRWKARDISGDSSKALLWSLWWSLSMVEDGVVLRERGRSWWAPVADGRGSVWSCQSWFVHRRWVCGRFGGAYFPFPLRHGVVLS
jgi:hypothetical protein